jgi:CBS domain-containing protein
MYNCVPPHDRSRIVAAAQSVLDRGGWCVFEVCTDVPRQHWEARVVIFDLCAEEVADTVAEQLGYEPLYDARLTGCDRYLLRPDARMGAHLCYVAEPATEAPVTAETSPRGRTSRGRFIMFVRDGMNPTVVTVGPEHTLREAARRMTGRGVGAAVVIDHEAPGPGIITERDILHANGVGQSVDTELVREHLTSDVVYAAADWSLERAAGAMVRGGFRHVIVLDATEITGILSMRDIVRCWTADGATCEVAH